MSHLLDANSWVDHLRRGPTSRLTAKLAAAPPGSVYLCSLVVGELTTAGRVPRWKNVRSTAQIKRKPISKQKPTDQSEDIRNHISLILRSSSQVRNTGIIGSERLVVATGTR